MLVGSLGIKIDQLAGHHQVAGNDVTIGTRKGGQSAQSIAVELLSADAGRNRRLITVGRDVLIRRGVVLVTAVVTRRTPASAILEAAAAVVATLVATAVPTTIITRTKATAVVVTTLETATLAITTVIAEATTAIVTTLETTSLAPVGAFAIAVAPLRLALLVSTTAEFAASSSLFCHGVYPLFLRHMTLL